MDLTKIPTCKLVWESEKREGVEVKIVEPHTDTTIPVSGPAIVLVVID